MNDERRDELLLEIHQMIGKITVKLNADYRAIHGNGQPGLIEKHNALHEKFKLLEADQRPSNRQLHESQNEIEKKIEKLEQLHKDMDKKKTYLITLIALLINAIGTIYAIFKHH